MKRNRKRKNKFFSEQWGDFWIEGGEGSRREFKFKDRQPDKVLSNFLDFIKDKFAADFKEFGEWLNGKENKPKKHGK